MNAQENDGFYYYIEGYILSMSFTNYCRNTWPRKDFISSQEALSAAGW